MTSTPEGSRTRVPTTAKRLFAERGLGGVSLREIIREAGIKHSTATQYHFGDREGLVDAILAPHQARVDTRGEAMLDDCEANSIADCRAVATILIRPLARELEDEEGRYFLRIYAQKIQHAQGMFSDTGDSMWRWRRQAEQFALPGGGKFHPRFSARIFTTAELALRAVQDPHADDRLFVSRVIDVVAAILQAPVSPATERLEIERRTRHRKLPEDQIA